MKTIFGDEKFFQTLGFTESEARVAALKMFFGQKILEYSKGIGQRRLREILDPEAFPNRSTKQAIQALKRGKFGAFDVGELAGFAMTLAELGSNDRT